VRKSSSICLLTLIMMSHLSTVASAQTSAITGTVKDSTGAVLPGVEIAVSSPALIEGARATISDEFGKYRVAELVPGIYSVSFSLPGFRMLKREGVELVSDFTASVNAEMLAGSLSETVEVTTESPIVDTESITTITVMTREVLDIMPTGRNIQAVGIMIPGTSIQVGGAAPFLATSADPEDCSNHLYL